MAPLDMSDVALTLPPLSFPSLLLSLTIVDADITSYTTLHYSCSHAYTCIFASAWFTDLT